MKLINICHGSLAFCLCFVVGCAARWGAQDEQNALEAYLTSLEQRQIKSESATKASTSVKSTHSFNLNNGASDKNTYKPMMRPFQFVKGTASRLEKSIRHHFWASDDVRENPSFIGIFASQLGKQLSREINRSGDSAYTANNVNRLADPSFSELGEAIFDSGLYASKKLLIYTARNEEEEYDWPDNLLEYISADYLMSAGVTVGFFAIASALESDKISGTLPLEDAQFIDDFLLHQGRIWFDSTYDSAAREKTRAYIGAKREEKNSVWSHLELDFQFKRIFSERRRIQLVPIFNVNKNMSFGLLFIANGSPDEGEIRGNDIEDFGDHTRFLYGFVFEIK